MVDWRKKMHQEMAAFARRQYSHVLESIIPYLAQVEQMGLHREPVPASAPNSRATKAYQALWAEVRQVIQSD